MGNIFVTVVSRVLFWTYQRGSWQYDIVCVLILAFIFLTPRAVFDGSAFLRKRDPGTIEEKDNKVRETHALNSPTGQSQWTVPGGSDRD